MYHLCHRSQRAVFNEYSRLADLHREMADLYAQLGRVEEAEYHYATCSGLKLEDPNSGEEINREELVNHISIVLPSSIASKERALGHLTDGKTECDNQEGRDCDKARVSLLLALRCSRLCGATDVELRALFNLAILETAVANHIKAASYCDQCCRLLKVNSGHELLKVMHRRSIALKNARLFTKATRSIDESRDLLMSHRLREVMIETWWKLWFEELNGLEEEVIQDSMKVTAPATVLGNVEE